MNAPVAPVRLQPDFAQRPIPEAFLQALAQRFGAQCSTALAVREQHGRDEGAIQAPPPAAVVFAESTQDVQDALKLADQHAVPVIPYGAGSSLEGHLLAVEGGISLDLSRMNRILSVNAEDLTVTVQPGITRKQLNDAIKDTGFFFPIDPGADASIGGMTATRASGHELLLEVIPPKDTLAPDDRGEAVLRAIRHFYDLGLKPEWWKVGTMARENWEALDALVNERDPWCRGAVILGLSQPVEQLVQGFAQARAPVVKGFMIGRSVWAGPALQWLRNELDDAALRDAVAANFRALIAGWDASRVDARQDTTEGAAA